MANKMILIPEDVWQKINTKPETFIGTLNDLEEQIKLLLDSEKFSDFEKIKLINQLQNRYNKIQIANTKDKNDDDANKITNNHNLLNSSNKQTSKDRFLHFFTKTSRKRGEQLLNFLENTSKIEWNEKDELVINGIAIEKSNIIDLLMLTVSNRSKIDLIGINEYINLLANLNIPKYLIVNNKIKKIIDTLLNKHQDKPQNKSLLWEEES